MQSETFDSQDLGQIEAFVSQIYSKLHIGAVALHLQRCIAYVRNNVAFRHHLDTTPGSYPRRVRVTHAHEILAGRPRTTA